MPQSGAERTRKYREKLKRERPEALEIQRKKNLERIKSKTKRISELTAEKAEERRAKWKREKRASRQKKRENEEKELQNNISLHGGKTSSNNPQDKIGLHNEKHILQLRKKLRFVINEYRRSERAIKKLKTQKESYRKRFQRLKKHSDEKIRNLKTQLEKMRAREEILEGTLKKTYKNCKSRNAKQTLKALVSNSKNKTILTKSIGLKYKIKKNKNKVRQSNIEEIAKFYNRDDVSRNTAGRRETRTKSKVKVQIRYLLDTIVNSFKKYKSEGGRYGFTTFFRNKPFFVLSPGLNSRNTCLCIKHSNFGFLHGAAIKYGLIKLTSNEILKQVSCETNNYHCMTNKCQECKNKKVQFEPTGDDQLKQNVKWTKWERLDHTYVKKEGETCKEMKTKKTEKVTKTGTLMELRDLYEKEVIVHKKHYFNMNHQQAAYQKALKDLKDHEALIVCDFSENYDAKLAYEIQAMHFGASKRQISLHTGMVYWKSHSQSFCTLSDDTCHQPPAIWAHLTPILEMIKRESPEVTTVHFYSDGPTSQYRQKNNFYLLAHFTKTFDFKYSTWSFYEAGHGKNVADGIGGCVKRALDRKVCHGNDIVQARDAYNLLKQCLKTIKIYLIPDCTATAISKILPNKISVLKGTMQIHQIITNTNNANQYTVRYRDISCFCEEMRGQCDCFSPQSHDLTLSSSSDIQKIDIHSVPNAPEVEKRKSSPVIDTIIIPDTTIQNLPLMPFSKNQDDEHTHTQMTQLDTNKNLKEFDEIPAVVMNKSHLSIGKTVPKRVLHSDYKYKTQDRSKRLRLQCHKCLTTLSGTIKGKCMACAKWYCTVCTEGPVSFDYICDPCLED